MLCPLAPWLSLLLCSSSSANSPCSSSRMPSADRERKGVLHLSLSSFPTVRLAPQSLLDMPPDRTVKEASAAAALEKERPLASR